MINLAWKLGHFGANPAQRIWPSPRHGLSLPLACELDEKPFKTGENKAKQRHELPSFPSSMKVYRICFSVCLPLGLAVCPAIGEKSSWPVRIRTLRTQQRAKNQCHSAYIGLPLFCRSRKNMPNSFVFPWLRSPSKGDGYWVQKQKQLVKMK